jgi:shikimate kinase
VTDQRRAIVLIGAPGAGKTKTGKRVAKRLGLPFVDTDKRIVAEHGPIVGIFADYGEPHFRRIERAIVAVALHEGGVVTLGGGAVLDKDTQSDLARHTVIQLTVSPEAVAARIDNDKRPLLRDGIITWQSLVATRQPIYDRLADHTIDTSKRPLDQVADEIVALVQEES